LAITGATTIDAGTGNITLGETASTFGALALTGANVAVTENDATELAAVTVSGTFDITSGGAITDSGALAVTGASAFTNTDGTNAAITLNNSANTFAGNVNFTTDAGSDVTIMDNSDFAIQSGLNVNNLSITSTGSVTDLGDIDIDGTLAVSAAGQTIDLSGIGNDLSGAVTLTGSAVTLQDTTATSIAGITATGALSVTSGGAITQSGAIDADSTASFTAGANAITLTDAGNDFSGAVSLSNSGTNDVALTDTNTLDLGTVTVGQNLTLTTGGDLTDSGAITVEGLGTIVSTGQNITLGDSTAANFGSIDFAGANVSIKEGSAMELAASEATGILNLEASGAITQSGAIDADSTVSFTAGANAITLDNSLNDFSGVVSLSNSGTNDIGLRDVNDLELGTITTGQNLAVTASGAISDSGVITVAGATTLDNSGGTNAAIVLDSANVFTGAVSFTTDTGSDISIVDTTAFDIQALAANSLSVSAGGNISDSGVLDIATTVSLTTTAGNGNVVLNQASDFDGALSVTTDGTGTTSISNLTDSIELGTITTAQLALSATGAITDSGVITVSGTTAFDNSAGTDAVIDLDSASTYTGDVTFTVDAGSDVTIMDNSAFAIQSGLNVNNLSIISTGLVTDLGDIDIDGTLTVNAAGQSIELAGTGNDLTGAVNLTGAAVTLNDVTATSIAGITATGALSVTSGGAITQTGPVDADSTASFTAGANAITLTDTGNDFSGALSLSNSGTNEVALTDTNALDLGTVSVGQDLMVTTGGALSDSGTITIPGLFTVASTGQNVTLGDSTKANFGSIALDAANITVNENSATELGASTVSGTLAITSTGAVTDSGILAITGATTISTPGQSVSLTNADSTFGDFDVRAKNVYIVEKGNFSSTNISAETVQISATEGVSLTSSGDGLQLAAQSGTGNIDVVNTGGLVISELEVIKGIQLTNEDASGKISLVAKSPLTVNAVIDAKGGEVLLVASGSDATDDVTINSSIIGNSVDVYAGDSVAVLGDAKITSSSFELNIGTNFDPETLTTSTGSASAGLVISNIAGLEQINFPSLGIITGKARMKEFKSSGLLLMDDYFNALNPVSEQLVNLESIGVTGSIQNEPYNFTEIENSGSIEIENKK
jgi:hypothetical protein